MALAASPIADVKALLAAWRSLRGGLTGAWRDTMQLLLHRRVLVDTHAETRRGSQVVLRTRVRLDGDVQTDVLRCWLAETAAPAVEALAKTHFQSVSDATRGLPAARIMARLAAQLLIVVGVIAGILSNLHTLLAEGWRALLPALLAHWWILSGFALAAFGFLLRPVLRFWLRRKFQSGLFLGPSS